MEDFTYTSRQLNSVSTSLALYNFAVVCETQQMAMVEASLLKCYDHVSTVLAHNNETAPISSGKTDACIRTYNHSSTLLLTNSLKDQNFNNSSVERYNIMYTLSF